MGYAEFVATHNLQDISRAIIRLSRLHNLLMLEEKNPANKLPDIITNNEVRVALKSLMIVENDMKDITDMLTEIYRATKPPKADVTDEPTEQKRGCENCGNKQCANGPIAFNWDECVKSKFEKHWRPKEG